MYYIDKKVPVFAGKAYSKILKVGYKIVRLVYDSPQMDCQIAEYEIRRLIY